MTTIMLLATFFRSTQIQSVDSKFLSSIFHMCEKEFDDCTLDWPVCTMQNLNEDKILELVD